MRNRILPVALAALLSALAVARGYTPSKNKPPFVSKQDMCGIWRLKIGPSVADGAPIGPPPESANGSKMPTNDQRDDERRIYQEEKVEDEVALRLNDDGTFDPYMPIDDRQKSNNKEDLDLRHVLGRGGCWEYRDECLILAANRPPEEGEVASSAKKATTDTIFKGKLLVGVSECLDEIGGAASVVDGVEEEDGGVDSDSSSADIDVHLSVPQGKISTGKFFYPQKHAAFFDHPMLFEPMTAGKFYMNQLLGSLNTRLQREKREDAAANTEPEAKFHKRDFYNRTFYLTATPHPVDEGYAARDIHYDETKATLDVRVLPIMFHPNNTFSAIGTGKILRGRYGISGKERDSLWFQVSLFGAGRSAPGSVYSEGRMLSQDDRRGYVGPIQTYPNKKRRNETSYFVDGHFYYGTDLKRAGKPHSMGTFTLQEVDEREVDVGYDDDGGGVDNFESSKSNMPSWKDEDNAFQ